MFTLLSNTAGFENTGVGRSALQSNTTGNFNTASGYEALKLNFTGVNNTATGGFALASNNGNQNTATGAAALGANLTGNNNTATGVFALSNNGIGNNNTAFGYQSLQNNTTGSFNVALAGGFNLTTGDFNIDIGSDGIAGEANTIRIGDGCCQNETFIAGIRGVTTVNNDAIPVLIDSAGQLGTASSSRRYKTDIKRMDIASESILALKPVSFRYTVHKDMKPQFGLIAEDVAKVNRDLVIYDANGEPYTVRYDAVNAMLLNEFLKEYRKTEKLEATVVRQQKQIDALTAGLEKVSAHLELSKPAPQTVLNNR